MTNKTFAVILERWLAGDSITDLAWDYDVDKDEIEQLIREAFKNGI
jgi:uncharacterized protein (DUF433 family)